MFYFPSLREQCPLFSHCFPDLDFRLIPDFLDTERYLVILGKGVKLA